MIARQPATPEASEQPLAAEPAVQAAGAQAAPVQDGASAGLKAASPVDVHAIRRGWIVLGSDGEKVGEVLALSHALSGGDGYLIVQQRHFFMKKDFYLPASTIARIENQHVVLGVTRKVVEGSGWDAPPRR